MLGLVRGGAGVIQIICMCRVGVCRPGYVFSFLEIYDVEIGLSCYFRSVLCVVVGRVCIR